MEHVTVQTFTTHSTYNPNIGNTLPLPPLVIDAQSAPSEIKRLIDDAGNSKAADVRYLYRDDMSMFANYYVAVKKDQFPKHQQITFTGVEFTAERYEQLPDEIKAFLNDVGKSSRLLLRNVIYDHCVFTGTKSFELNISVSGENNIVSLKDYVRAGAENKAVINLDSSLSLASVGDHAIANINAPDAIVTARHFAVVNINSPGGIVNIVGAGVTVNENVAGGIINGG